MQKHLWGAVSTTLTRLRRQLFILLAVLLVGTTTSCASSADAPVAKTDKPYVLATFTVLADIARNIGGDYIQVESLIKPGAQIHGYEPTPSDIKKATEANLILANGFNLESWLKRFIQTSSTPVVTVTEGITPISITEDVDAGYPNPHAWMSPVAAKTYVDNIEKAFAHLDPAHAEQFAANARAYKQQLSQVHDELVDSLAKLPEQQRRLVTCEGAFSYLVADSGMKESYLWAVNSDGQTGARRIMAVTDTVRDNHVPAVFCESTVSPRTMHQVADESGARYLGPLYVDSLSEPDGPVPTYLDLIRYDTRLISQGLGDQTGKTSDDQ